MIYFEKVVNKGRGKNDLMSIWFLFSAVGEGDRILFIIFFYY